MGKSAIQEPLPDPANPTYRQVLDIGLSSEERTVGSYGELGFFRASSMGYCLRRQVFDRAKVRYTKEKKAQDHRTLSLGNVYHAWLQRRLWLSGLLLQEELTLVDPRLGVSGHVDAVWGGEPQGLEDEYLEKWSPKYVEWVQLYREEIRETFGYIPVTADEFKSAADYSIHKMWEEGPSFAHKHQVGTYWFLRDSLLKSEDTTLEMQRLLESIERWGLCIVGKGDMSMVEFTLRPDQAKMTASRIYLLLEFWNEAKLPPCTCGDNISWEAKYCAYRDPGSSDNAPLCCSPQLFDQIDWTDIRKQESALIYDATHEEVKSDG